MQGVDKCKVINSYPRGAWGKRVLIKSWLTMSLRMDNVGGVDNEFLVEGNK